MEPGGLGVDFRVSLRKSKADSINRYATEIDEKVDGYWPSILRNLIQYIVHLFLTHYLVYFILKNQASEH